MMLINTVEARGQKAGSHLIYLLSSHFSTVVWCPGRDKSMQCDSLCFLFVFAEKKRTSGQTGTFLPPYMSFSALPQLLLRPCNRI